MSGDSEERYVRACKRHLAPLSEQMRCPGGGHRAHYCKAWIVVDRHTGRVLNSADVDGHREELNVPVNAMKAEKHRKQPQLAAEKLGKGGQVLWIRLLQSAHGEDAHRYRVCWQLIKRTEGGAAAEERGTCAACPDEKAGRKAWEGAVSAAQTAGFVKLPVGVGAAHRLVLKPLPITAAAERRPKS